MTRHDLGRLQREETILARDPLVQAGTAAELKKAGRTIDETLTTLQAELGPTYGASPRMAGPIRAAYNQAP